MMTCQSSAAVDVRQRSGRERAQRARLTDIFQLLPELQFLSFPCKLNTVLPLIIVSTERSSKDNGTSSRQCTSERWLSLVEQYWAVSRQPHASALKHAIRSSQEHFQTDRVLGSDELSVPL